jgi:hypothetical protein
MIVVDFLEFRVDHVGIVAGARTDRATQSEAQMGDKRIGLREIRALGAGETVWDSAVPAFGDRRQKGRTVSFVLKFRTAEGRQRWHTIGRHGAPWTPDAAREEAKRAPRRSRESRRSGGG